MRWNPGYRPRLEALEERSQPAVFVVTNHFDIVFPDGGAIPGSFRWAIQQANQHPNSENFDSDWDVIQFQVPKSGPFVIQLQQPLGPVTDPVVLDASQQPGFDPTRDEVFFIYLPRPLDPLSEEMIWTVQVWIGVPGFDGGGDWVPDRPRRPVDTDRPVDPSIPGLLQKEAPQPSHDRQDIDAVFLPDAEPQLFLALPRLPARRPPSGGGSDLPVFRPGDEIDTGKIMGTLFIDDDGDGRFGPEESPAPDRLVYLDLNRNGRLDEGEPTAVTNHKGEYRFEYLRPGHYQIEQVLWPHLVQTLPKEGGNAVELSAGEVIMDVDFGAVKVQKRRVVPVSIPDGDSRRPEEPRLHASSSAVLFASWLLLPASNERKRAA